MFGVGRREANCNGKERTLHGDVALQMARSQATAAQKHRSIPWATTKTQIRSNRGKSNLESSITIQATCPERLPVHKKKMSLNRNPPLITAADVLTLILKANKKRHPLPLRASPPDIINTRQRLLVVVAHDKTGGAFLDRPGWREAATLGHSGSTYSAAYL